MSLSFFSHPLLRQGFVACWLLSALPVAAQVTLSGYVRDGQSGEVLIGATVYVPALKKGAYANEYGYYALTLPPGNYEVYYRFVGFEPDTLRLALDASQRHDVHLFIQQVNLEAVEISSRPADDNVAANQMGVSSLSIQEVKKLPVFFGETDILKSIQLLPGVKSAGEGSSGFYVRGGGLDQNLILLDEAPVYNASHLLGFFSVFNGDAINSTQLYKGNMPASYGGRLSSTLDIRMKEGNNKNYHVSGGLGLISSRLTAEGPIVADEGSFMISGRRTYADIFLALSSDSALSNSQLYFYDLNAKANYTLGQHDHLYISGYFGRDVMGFRDQFGINWGNATGTLRWNHLFSDKLFLNSSFTFSDYDYQINFNAANAAISSGIRDFNWKEDFSYYAGSNHSLKWGLNAIYHTFTPGVVTFENTDTEPDTDQQDPNRYALETAAYFSGDWSASEQIKLSYGLRYSNFSVLGPGDFYTFDPEGNVLDTLSYSAGELVTHYGGLEPRLSATWILGSTHSLKAAYARNRQYVHMLSNSTSGTPADVWLPSSTQIKPEIADQLSLGYFRNFANNGWETSVELYYKKLYNQIEYRDGADILLNDLVEGQLVFGEGQAYGAEFFVKKTTGQLTGWVGYTLSRTLRQFEDINDGNPFPARQDRIHDLSVVAVYDPGPHWSFSGAWVYRAGDAVTFPSGSYVFEGNVLPLYTTRNGYRLPAYHRLDLSATWYYSGNKDNNLNLSLYNAYGRKNVYTIDFRPSETNPGSIEAVKTYLFRWVPSVTWNFAF
ncbi:MAG: TonB-dependent receptor [Bacteroidia bacterium]|nr:TonB-dependent receptor [Bacteroidia bacterium]